MRFSNAINAFVLILFGAFIAQAATRMPGLRLIDYGTGFFPMVIGIGLLATGVLMLVAGRATDRVASGDQPKPPPVMPRTETADPGSFFVTVGSVIFYILAVETLGFVPSMTVALTVLIRWFGTSLFKAFLIAVMSSTVLYLFFHQLMSVPLAWGILWPLERYLS